MSAAISALTGGHPVRWGQVHFPGDQAAVSREHGGGCDQAVRPQRSGQEPDELGEDCAVGPVQPGGVLVRRSTAASCRSTSRARTTR
jgi:hypothetical protein